MNRLLRSVAVVFAVLVLLLVAAQIATRAAPVQRWLGRYVAARIGPGVRVGRIDLALLPPFGVRLCEARVEDPESGRNLLELGELVVGIAFADLLGERRLRLSALALAGVTLHLDLRAEEEEGRAIDVISGLLADSPSKSRSAATGNLSAVDLPIVAKDVVIIVQPEEEESPPLEIRLPSLDMRIRRPAGDPTMSADIRAELARGEVGVSIRATREDAGQTLDLDFEAEELSLPEIFAKPPGDFRRAGLSASLRRRAGSTTMSGTGALHLSEGVVSSASLGAALWKAIFTLLPKSGNGAGSLVRSKPTVLEHLTTRFEIRNRSVELDDLELAADDYVVTGDGSVAFDGRLAMDLRVSLTPTGFAKMLLVAKLPLSRLPVKKLPPIPLAVSGTMERPRVQPKVRSLPFDLLAYTTGAAGKVTKGVLGTARGLIENGTKRAREMLRED